MLLLPPTLLESNETRLAPVVLHGSASDQWGTFGFVGAAVILRGRQGAALADREGLRGTESICRSFHSLRISVNHIQVALPLPHWQSHSRLKGAD